MDGEDELLENDVFEKLNDDDDTDDGNDQVLTPDKISSNEIISGCADKMRKPDFIMESDIFATLKTYFQHGGSPEQVVELLVTNYHARAQKVNILAEWLIVAGVTVEEVQAIVESSLKDLIIQNFDPRKADAIFLEEGQAPTWLSACIQTKIWREMLYSLVQAYPDCLLLSLAIKLISDSGFHMELACISTIVQQEDVFVKVVCETIKNVIAEGHSRKHSASSNLLVELALFNEATYLITQAILKSLQSENKSVVACQFLSQKLEKKACTKFETSPEKLTNFLDINLRLDKAPLPTDSQKFNILREMIHENRVTTENLIFLRSNQLPVYLAKNMAFIKLLISVIFSPRSISSPPNDLDPSEVPTCISILAYSACCIDGKKAPVANSEEHKHTAQLIDKFHGILASKTVAPIIQELPFILGSLKMPILASGLLHWLSCHFVNVKFYADTSHDDLSLFFVLLDEIASCQFTLLDDVLILIIRLLSLPISEALDDDLLELALRKRFVDRLVHLCSKNFVLPVLHYISHKLIQEADPSVVRHFVSELVDIVAPPFSPEFLTAIKPIISNPAICGPLQTSKNVNTRKAFEEVAQHILD